MTIMVGFRKIISCIAVLFKTQTIPKKDWFWLFFSILFTTIKYPESLSRGGNYGKKTHFLSDYLPHPIKVKSPDGVLFIARPKFEDLARFLFSSTVTKWEPISLIKPKENDVVLGIGANIGYYTLRLASSVGKNGKVIAIEADPESSKVLENNCKLNKVQNVEIHNCAVTEKEGQIKLYQSSTHSGINSIFADVHGLDSNYVDVPAVKLDELLGKRFQTIDWIKIDVEGAELSVLKGSEEILKITKNILIELHEDILKQNNENPQTIIDILKSNNFKITFLYKYWDEKTSRNKGLKYDYIFCEKRFSS